ncbi:MAG: alpha-L-rhamnosidase C-terminal domain-containing protein, partial [Flavobacteriaceae bacterium]
VDKGLSDHESLEPVPIELTGTAHYLQCAEIMQTFASAMQDRENEKKYGQLAKKLRSIIRTRFWDVPVTEKINRQTLFSTLLYHKIVPPLEIKAAKDSLAKAIANGPSGHLNTGIFGTKYALESISEHLSPDATFDIVNSTAFPGWGFMIDQGATTIWETWKESDDVYSNCHPMFGSVSEWFYRWLGGIRPDQKNPGFKKFILAPNTPKELDYVQTSYESPYGTIISNWKRNPSGTITYEMEIPKKSIASTTLPVDSLKEIKILKEGIPLKAENIKNLDTGNFELIEGNYIITLSPN